MSEATKERKELNPPAGSVEFVTARWLYKTLRAHMSWESTADKKYWEGEARKLRQRLAEEFLSANAETEPRRQKH